jgi:hypothetical protein
MLMAGSGGAAGSSSRAPLTLAGNVPSGMNQHMSANPVEQFTAYVGANTPVQVERLLLPERRKRARAKLHGRVWLFRNEVEDAMEGLTQDLSSDGFYCLAGEWFAAGETLICSLKVPSHKLNGNHLEGSLECKIRVMRVESQGEGMYGIACRIEDYHFAAVVER